MTMNDAAAAAADLDDDYSDTISIDTCEEYIHFESIRNPSTQLEESISFSWPGIYCDGVVVDGDGSADVDKTATYATTPSVEGDAGGNQKKLRKIILSTLLEEDDIAPLFDGARWAGTRLWRAAIRCIQYLAGHLPDAPVHPNVRLPKSLTTTTTDVSNEINNNDINSKNDAISVLELGCGLGVPGMIFHLLGCNVVLTDQEDILSQLQKNVDRNFRTSSISSISSNSEQSTCDKDQTNAANTTTTIQAQPLSWSRKDVNSLLEQVGRSETGFDVVVNCDCVFEPLYGKR
jgi:hypothetical protein